MAFCFWSLIAALETIQVYLRFLSAGNEVQIEGKSISWFQWAIRNVPGWYVLALFTPLILGLGRKFPITRRKSRLTSVLMHLLCSFGFAAIYLLIESIFARVIVGLAFSPELVFQSFEIRLKNAFHLIVASYWAILAACQAFDFYTLMRARSAEADKLAMHSAELENLLTTAKLEVLKAQLHPHFLFNSLNAVSALVEEHPRRARRMIARISDLLRMTLDSADQQTVSLKREIDQISLYLDIEKERFGDNLTVNFKIDSNLLNTEIPCFLLQPLVENSIKHGREVENGKPLEVVIEASRCGGLIKLTISDNGSGIPIDEPVSEGIGLENTKARLAAMYGDNHGFELSNAKGKRGAVVAISFPAKERL